MKKLIFAFAAFAALLSSCSKDDTASGVNSAVEEQIVTFDVSSPELATRYGEGNEATMLEWWVYEVSSTGRPTLVSNLYGSKTLESKQTTVNLKLVQGRKYNVLFWAHSPNISDTKSNSGVGHSEAVYCVDPENATMDIYYEKMEANKESYDAFYKYYNLGVVTSSTNGGTVSLTRPFAQVNVATTKDDIDAAKLADLDVKYTGIKVVKAYTTLNFATGAVSNAKEITFKTTQKASGDIEYNGVKYEIISMNYLLVNEKTLVDLNLRLQESAAVGAEVLTRDYSKISVQRNHRTYVLGDIYTQPATFNVIIKEGFVGNYFEGENN